MKGESAPTQPQISGRTAQRAPAKDGPAEGVRTPDTAAAQSGADHTAVRKTGAKKVRVHDVRGASAAGHAERGFSEQQHRPAGLSELLSDTYTTEEDDLIRPHADPHAEGSPAATTASPTAKATATRPIRAVPRESAAAPQLDGDSGAVPVPSSRAGVGVTMNIARDEMNLAEFPLTVLSKRVDPAVKTLEFTDSIKGKNGELINRTWIITGADRFGLPTSSDDEVLLGLLKLTADEGLNQRKVHFTRYELLRILRWTTEGRSYTRLQNALDRLSGVRIKATNAFYDNESKLHSTRNFGIIDEYEINDGRDTRPSFFTWSEVLFNSFQVGFIKKLDLNFYLDLESAVSKRLYRYLDKHFWYRSRIQMDLFTLAHEKIGISRNYIYASSLRQQIEPALEELTQKGMLSQYEFIGKGKSTEVVLTAATAPRKTLTATASAPQPGSSPHGAPLKDIPFPVRPPETAAHPTAAADQGDPDPSALIDLLVARGIVERQARKLLLGQGAEALQRCHAIVAHFDTLVASNSVRISKNPQGFLYKAVEHPFEYTLPSDRAGETYRTTGASGAPFGNRTTTTPPHNAAGAARPAAAQQPLVFAAAPDAERSAEELQKQYLSERRRRLDEIQGSLSESEKSALYSEVEAALSKIRSHITRERFKDVVAHGVDERLLERHNFPDFKRWCARAGGTQGAAVKTDGDAPSHDP